MCYALWKLPDGFYEYDVQGSLCIILWTFCPNSKEIKEAPFSVAYHQPA